MIPQEWNAKLHKDVLWAEAFKTVEAEVRAHCATLLPGKTLSTRELVCALYPPDAVRGDLGEDAVARMYDLVTCTREKYFMAPECRTRSEVARKQYGKSYKPWLWHAPVPVKRCPTCGQVVP